MGHDERLDTVGSFLKDSEEQNVTAGKYGEGNLLYFASALYMLLMPPRRRQRLAAFFTPPHLCDHVLDRLEKYGMNDGHTALDPACGGAAFLVPLATRRAKHLRDQGFSEAEALRRICAQLRGYEIEPGLAKLSRLLIKHAISAPWVDCIVERGNALAIESSERFDVVVGNPPYGRVFRPSKRLLSRWSEFITDGHVNTYLLFIALSLELAKPGGLIALIVPTSLIGGPYFIRLRSGIRRKADILEINVIEKRSDEFLDVVQDTCVLILRRRSEQSEVAPQAACNVIEANGAVRCSGQLELSADLEAPWVLPHEDKASLLYDVGYSTLEDYGYSVKAGYFVWNRSRDLLRMGPSPLPGEIPLIWAHDVKAGGAVALPPPTSTNVSFVKVPPESPALLKTPFIVLQRTTSRSQSKRLIAALVSSDTLAHYGSVVTENHTIVISPIEGRPQKLTLEEMMQLLNTEAVDQAYRRVSGTVSVSVKVLRSLPLPSADTLRAAIDRNMDISSAAAAGYRRSLD